MTVWEMFVLLICTNLTLLTLPPLTAAHTHTHTEERWDVFVCKGQWKATVPCVCLCSGGVLGVVCVCVCGVVACGDYSDSSIPVCGMWVCTCMRTSLHVYEKSHAWLMTSCEVHACLNYFLLMSPHDATCLAVMLDILSSFIIPPPIHLSDFMFR